jgi:hypothetical protein
MKKMLPILASLLLAVHPEADAAFRDRALLPYEQQNNAVYLSLSEVVPAERDNLEAILKFVVPSLSHKPYLGDQIPARVPNTNLLRLDLSGLGWEKSWPEVIQKYYVPLYRPDLAGTKGVPLVVNGLWFAACMMDSQLTGDSQYLLLYGKPLANTNEFRSFWTANGNPDLTFGRIEGQSGVSVELTRLIENLPTANRGYFWQTFDSRKVAGASDPLENLAKRPIKHDASELIAAIPKHYAGKSGTLQAYFLANEKGERQEKAPADIVTDTTLVRGVEIRNTVSCISCHEEGIRHPTLDQYKEYILSGARVYAKEKALQQEIDRYLNSPIAKEIIRNNEDYEAGLVLVNGLTSLQNARLFRQFVRLYDAPVSPEQAALEMYMTTEEWRLALGNYSRTGQLSGRLALMAQGQTISRKQWEENQPLAYKVRQLWHSGH